MEGGEDASSNGPEHRTELVVGQAQGPSHLI